MKESDEYLAFALWESRTSKNKSQEFMSLEMGIARRTVQNWEKGVSKPTIDQALEWFGILDLNPLPYLFQYVHPEMKNIGGKDNDERLREVLRNLVEVLPSEGMRQLLYLFYGDHGSSPRAVLNMVTAHLQTPMRDRVTAGSVILKNYDIAHKKGLLTDINHIQPNVELLKDAIEKGECAVVKNEETYVLLKKNLKEK